jgi:polysaccharide biosynthesis/export protein
MTRPGLESTNALRLLGFITLAATLTALGCQKGIYRAAQLPPEWQVHSSTRADTINIAHMSGPGQRGTLIAPGDVLAATISTGRENERPQPFQSRVADDGTVDVPLVGPVIVANMEPFEASQAIADASVQRQIYLRPHVAIEVKSKATNRITVLGAVAKPGAHELPRTSCDLLAALGAAGGLTKEAGTEVEILRQGGDTFFAEQAGPANDGVQPAAFGGPPVGATAPQLLRVDLAQATQPGASDQRLDDRDVVMVKPREKQYIHVTGLVAKPGQFELSHQQDVRMLDAVAMAGGCNSPVGDKVFVIRRVAGKPEPVTIQASISKAKRSNADNLMLAAGDLVSVEQTPATVVVDGVMRFFRVAVSMSGSAPLF